METVNLCENCFEASIPECTDEIKIGGFQPNQSLILYVENFHGKKNARDLTADGDGVITLDYNQFGKAFFGVDNSPYIFTFREDLADCEALPFTQCVDGVQQEFTCLAVDFVKVNDPTLFPNEINCQCAPVGPQPTN